MNNNGFTLVEIVIGMAILSVTVLVATLGFTTIVQLQQKAKTVQHIQQNTRYIMEVLSRDVRNSDTYYLFTDPESDYARLRLPNNINDDAVIRYTYNPENEGNLYRYPCTYPNCLAATGTAGENLVPSDVRLLDMDLEKLNEQSGTNSPLQVYLTAAQRENLDETDPYYYEYDATTVVVPRR